MSRILVVGDVMLDRYLEGSVERISPEAPVPVLKVQKSFDRPGGAANVAMNIKSLGGQVTLAGYVGIDDNGELLRKQLNAHGIPMHLLASLAHWTTTKVRYMSGGQQLLRVDHDSSAPVETETMLHQHFQETVFSYSVVVLSDYAKGVLDPTTTASFIRKAIDSSCILIVDPKGADWSKYAGATVITPNMAELEAVIGKSATDDELFARATQLLDQYDIQAMLLTRSEKGVALLRCGQDPLLIPSMAREVFDVTGAGDTVVAALAVALSEGMDMASACELANRAAGIAVGKAGTATVSAHELFQPTGKVLCLAELKNVTAKAKADGQEVVLTNGCFDILHAGHIRCLEAAKAEGDILVVAVNSDESVRQLKGSGRPILKLADRMQMLAALECVDWVVPFHGETPTSLIEQILPDVLVKGGDYAGQPIAGERAVLKAGGRVYITDRFEGHSTSSIVSAIAGKGVLA